MKSISIILKRIMQLFLTISLWVVTVFIVSADSPGDHATYLPIIQATSSQARFYYISPSGDNNKSGTSETEAWATFNRAWQDIQPADTLILLDGIYYQSLAPNVTNGKPDKPITIRAKNDGQAIIDGQYQRVPVQLGPWPGATRDYYIIEGIVARNSSDHVYDINGSHNILRRVSGYNANKDTNSHVFILTGHDSLIEDCIASGTGRKMVFTWGGQNNTIRRCFTNWVRYDSRQADIEWPWGEDLEFYNSSDSIMEDSISYGSPPKTAVSVYGNIDSSNGNTPYSRNNKVLGVMVVRNGVFKDGTFWEWPTNRPQPTAYDVIRSRNIKQWTGWRIGFGVIMWGQQAEVSNTFFQDIFSWGNASLGFSEIGQFHSSTNTTINRATIANNGLDLAASPVPAGTDVIPSEIAHYTITNSKIEGTQFQSEGARLQHRYIDGVLMDGSNGQPEQPLWPWSMQDRVIKELGIDVTGEMTEILQNVGVPTGSNLPAPLISPAPPPGNSVENVPGATHLAPVIVTLSSSTAGVTIRYTTDGSEPTATSSQYTDPFTLSSTTLVKAKTFLNDQASHTRSAYYQIASNMTNQPPEVEAYLLPFIYPQAQLMFPTKQTFLYGKAEDHTLPTDSSDFTTTWNVVSGQSGVTFADLHKPRTKVTFTTTGTYVLRLNASDGQLTASADVTVTVLPEGGFPITIPSRVEAEDYKAGGEGVGYHDTSYGNYGQVYRSDDVDIDVAYTEGSGYSVISMRPGEWLAYNITIPQTGVYSLSTRVAGAVAGGVFHIELDGTDISGPITIPYTSDTLKRYVTITKQTPSLPHGQYQLRIVADQAAPDEVELFGGINYLDFTP